MIRKYAIPGLCAICVLAAVAVVTAMRAPVEYELVDEVSEPRTLHLPEGLTIAEFVPTMEEVLAKHLFVPERMATGQNSFPDLVVKGVYIGNQCNAVFSLKSKPMVNLRVWQGDEQSTLNLVEDEKDMRKPITDYLREWEIKKVGFDGVVFEHMLTGEREVYTVDYTPLKKVNDSAGAGYGQGQNVVGIAPASKSSSAARPSSSTAQTRQMPSSSVVAGRMSAYMSKLSPSQRAAIMKKLNTSGGGGNSRGSGGDSKSTSSNKKSSKKRSKKNR